MSSNFPPNQIKTKQQNFISRSSNMSNPKTKTRRKEITKWLWQSLLSNIVICNQKIFTFAAEHLKKACIIPKIAIYFKRALLVIGSIRLSRITGTFWLINFLSEGSHLGNFLSRIFFILWIEKFLLVKKCQKPFFWNRQHGKTDIEVK